MRVDVVERRLQRGVRDRAVQVRERRAERGERLEQRRPALEVGAERDDGEHRRAPALGSGNGGAGGTWVSTSQSETSSGASTKNVARVAQRGCRVVELVEERPAEHERTDLVQPVLEGDDDAEVAGAAAQPPEEVGVLVRRRA